MLSTQRRCVCRKTHQHRTHHRSSRSNAHIMNPVSSRTGAADAVDRPANNSTAAVPSPGHPRRRNTALSSATFPRHAAQVQRRSTATTTMAGNAASSSNCALSTTTNDQPSRHNFDRSADQTVTSTSGAANAMSLKLSVSMISLQPPNAAQTPEAGMPSLRQERPYNSLKVGIFETFISGWVRCYYRMEWVSLALKPLICISCI